MADPNAPAQEDPFAQIDPAEKPTAAAPAESSAEPAPSATPAPSNDNQPTDPFAGIGPEGEVAAGPSGAAGSFARGAEKGALPAAGSLAAVGAGAELGGAGGALVAGPVGGLVGGIAGGLLGGYAGGAAVQQAQNWAVHKLPESWQDTLGFSDRQARLDEAQHATASFMGGLVAYAVTMSPKAILSDLPHNATMLQRILAHPVTGRLFGGTLMGGMEAGNEELSKENLDWRKVAIATVFGTVFNRPNQIGEKVTELGGAPVRTVLGRPHPTPAPTLAQAADSKTFGPGITESVFQGTQEQAPEAAMTAQENARVEQNAIGEPPEPDLHGIARQMEPETFAKYDDLLKRRETFQSWHGEGPGAEAAEKHLAATEAEIRELSPDIAAAYRRAADTVGTGTVEPERFPSFAAMLAARENETPKTSPQPSAGTTFTTAKGSTYQVHDDGTTTRNKAARSDAGHEGDFGPKPRTDKTIYVDPQVASELSGAGLQGLGPKGFRVAIRGGKAYGLTWNEKANNWGASPSARDIPFTTEPEVGKSPVELWKPANDVPGHEAYRGQHAGNAITEVKKAQADPAGEPSVQPSGEAPGNIAGQAGAPAPVAPVPQRTIGEQRASIAADVSQKLIAAGRPPEEAAAAAQLIAARYVTRAGRFGGKLGTPEELYAREGAAIAGPKGEPQAPSLPTNRQELADYFAKGGKVEAAPKEMAQDQEPIEPIKTTQTDTPEFHNWFGESQVKDAAGKPKVVYHGTARGGFDMFDTYASEHGLMGSGTYFTENPDVASSYTSKGAKKMEKRGEEPRPSVYPVYLKIEHPIDMDVPPNLEAWGKAFSDYIDPESVKDAKTNEDVLRHVEDNIADERIPKYEGSEIIQEGMRAMGFDGITHIGGGRVDSDGVKHKVWIAFDPEQIKSATANQGTFDPNNPKILAQAANAKINLNPRGVKGRDFLGVEGTNPVIGLLKSANASSFIHESGHQFLAELLRDADHPEAPMDLRDDAQTVRDWLGVTDDIKTKHHEKFARGFEQYLREGVAPSPELAGVFAKFRNWLLSIYQSIKGLGTEITPDIRNVFDRMLEQEPNRTVIAPERPAGGPLLHEVHAGDALHAEPHEADALADRAAAERERYIQEPRPEIAHEIAASVQKDEAEQAARAGTESGGKDGGGAVGSSEVEPNSGGSGPQPDGSGVGTGGGEVGGGGSKPSAESAAAAKSDPRSKLGEHAGTALAPGPADIFGSRESPFTDRAGNIRVENLTTREDVAQAIRDSAAENNDFVGDRRGVITDGQVLELADALGMDAQTLNQRQLGQAFNAEQIVAARKLLIQSATDVSAAMKKAAIGTDEDVMAYAEAKDRHQLIQAQIAGITAEAGRALRAFRNIAGEESAQATDQFIKQATGKTLFQLRAEAKLGAELQTPQQVSKFMHDSGKTGFGRIVLEYWINGLISGPATHATYMVGNTISAIMKLPEAVASAAVGRAASALGRAGTGTAAGEAGALARGAVRGFAPAVKAGIDALRTGVTTALPGEGPAQSALPFQPGSELAQPAHLDEAATFHDAMSAAFGLVRGMRDTVISTAAMVAAGGVPGESLVSRQYSMNRATPNIAFKGVTVLPTGAIATLPSRGVAVIHSFFRSLVFSMEKNAMAYRKAADEGLEGTALHARVAQIRTDPSEDMMNQAAAHEATEAALMGKGSELTQRLAALTNTPIFGAPLLKFIDPFVRVSGNIIDQSLIRRTPVGLLTMLGPETELARDLTGKNGNVAQDKAIGRMMVGTTLAVTFGSLAAQKVLSGSGPKDPKEARVWMMAGNQPHSIRVGDTWYQVNKLGPMGMLASISADLYDVAHEAEQGDFTKAGAHLLHAITQNVLDESAMHGPAEMLKAIETPDRYGESYIRNYLAAFVPYSVGLGQMARAADPYQRDTRTLIDTIRNKIPGHLDSYFDHELPVRRDIWGEPLPSRTALGGAGVSAIYEQKINSDPVNQAMWKVGAFPGTVERKIHNVELTPDQYDDFARLAGRMAKMRLDKMVISPQFQQQIPSVQHDWMMETIKQSRESARQMIMIKNPAIIHQAHDLKTAKRQAINDRNPDE